VSEWPSRAFLKRRSCDIKATKRLEAIPDIRSVGWRSPDRSIQKIKSIIEVSTKPKPSLLSSQSDRLVCYGGNNNRRCYMDSDNLFWKNERIILILFRNVKCFDSFFDPRGFWLALVDNSTLLGYLFVIFVIFF
jgi:hypothetical protein